MSDFEELNISAGKTEKINYICQMQHNPNLMHATGNLIHPHLTHCSLGPGDSEISLWELPTCTYKNVAGNINVSHQNLHFNIFMYCVFTYDVQIKYSIPESCFFHNYCAISNQFNVDHYPYLTTFKFRRRG